VTDLPYVCSFLCAGMMGTELGMDIKLRGVFWVSSFDISQSVKRVKFTDPLFLEHCTMLLVPEYEW
jgi:hypothetical protein